MDDFIPPLSRLISYYLLISLSRYLPYLFISTYPHLLVSRPISVSNKTASKVCFEQISVYNVQCYPKYLYTAHPYAYLLTSPRLPMEHGIYSVTPSWEVGKSQKDLNTLDSFYCLIQNDEQHALSNFILASSICSGRFCARVAARQNPSNPISEYQHPKLPA